MNRLLLITIAAVLLVGCEITQVNVETKKLSAKSLHVSYSLEIVLPTGMEAFGNN
jgi:hypothetical protein